MRPYNQQMIMQSQTMNSPLSIFLDVDGTLLEFASHPDRVIVERPLVSLLNRLQHALGEALALVSGRSIASLDRLFLPFQGTAVGLHGIEFRAEADGEIDRIPFDPVPETLLAAITAASRPYRDAFIEHKQFAVTVHHRLDVATEQALRARLMAACAEAGPKWMVLPGRQVLEIKPSWVTKAHGVNRLMANAPFAGTLPIAFGDDKTDLDMFAAVRRHGGINVSVGPRIAGAGDLQLRSPGASLAMLADIALLLEQGHDSDMIVRTLRGGDARRVG